MMASFGHHNTCGLVFAGCLTLTAGCAEISATTTVEANLETPRMSAHDPPRKTIQTATLGAGCFWCVEAVFEQLAGVESVASGYAGGRNPNPTYDQVCSGQTGHAEVCQIRYDPEQLGYAELLEVFWKTHDPTTLNRQGGDEGTQYRSVIFYHDEEQRQLAEKYRKELDESGAWPNPVVTEISPMPEFYEAEKYHQSYYASNPRAPYCQFVIGPKMDKFRQVFEDKLKR